MKFGGILKSLACSAVLLLSVPAAQASVWSVGDLYSSNNAAAIRHYDASGRYIDSTSLPAPYGSQVKGLAFGAQGWLYAVSTMGSGMAVTALDSAGAVHESYAGPGYVAGNVFSGKIAFGANGQFYVAGANNLVAFTPGVSAGTVIYQNNQVFDVKLLPSGNLLVLSAYDLEEITPSGALVRHINTGMRLVDARGLEYDAVNDDIFVTMIGYANNFSQLMRFDGRSGALEAKATFSYGADMVLTASRQLVVGSWTSAPGIFDTNLNLLASLDGGAQWFVAQKGAPIPEPASLALLLAGMCAMGALRRRKQ